MNICPSCHRHVREATCPFCQATVESAEPLARARVGRGRAVLVAGALAISGGIASVHASGDNGNGAVPAYGIVPPPPTPPHLVDAGSDRPDAGLFGDAGRDTTDAGHASDAGRGPLVQPVPTPNDRGHHPLYGIPSQREPRH